MRDTTNPAPEIPPPLAFPADPEPSRNCLMVPALPNF